MTITIDLSEEVRERLAENAAARGQDLTQYVTQLIDREAEAPLSIMGAAKPFTDAVEQSGMSEQEFTATVQQAIDEVRAERRARKQG